MKLHFLCRLGTMTHPLLQHPSAPACGAANLPTDGDLDAAMQALRLQSAAEQDRTRTSTLVLLMLMAWLLAACAPVKPSKPIDVHCDDLCFAECAPLTAWDGDRDGERLTALMDAHDVEHGQCEAHRKACQNCIDAARAAKAIQ